MEGYFERVVERLTAAGYRWYETANFCRPGAPAGAADFRARHNLAYWLGRDYVGLGIGAVSTVAGERRRNLPSLARYVTALGGGAVPPPRELEHIDSTTSRQERVLLGLRLDEPLPLAGLETDARRGGARAARGTRPRHRRRNCGWAFGHADASGALSRRRRNGRAARLTRSAANAESELQATLFLQMALTKPDLTERQRRILRLVVEAYVTTGQPVGSKGLVERGGMDVSPSTVRNEFAALEGLGLLTHPHTSAGRVPTERGYRFYAGSVLDRVEARPGAFPLDLTTVRREVDAALQETTEMLSRVTRLLALVSAPPLETTTVRRVEVLLLQPDAVMILVITSTGGVTKRIVKYDGPVDPGLATWAGEYLNDRLAGLTLGSVLLRKRLADPELTEQERRFLETLRPAFGGAAEGEQRLYVGSAAGLLDDVRDEEFESYRRLLEVLEQRAALLELLRGSLDPRRPFVRVGAELEHPELSNVALVGAAYGLAHRTLGTVSLLGPVRMDYDKAIRSVHSAAAELSRFVEDVYEDN